MVFSSHVHGVLDSTRTYCQLKKGYRILFPTQWQCCYKRNPAKDRMLYYMNSAKTPTMLLYRSRPLRKFVSTRKALHPRRRGELTTSSLEKKHWAYVTPKSRSSPCSSWAKNCKEVGVRRKKGVVYSRQALFHLFSVCGLTTRVDDFKIILL